MTIRFIIETNHKSERKKVRIGGDVCELAVIVGIPFGAIGRERLLSGAGREMGA
jgi:hypothetical protein